MNKPNTVSAYIKALEGDRKEPMMRLMKIIRQNLPRGFEEVMNYGMPSWVVPHSMYPAGYHVTPELPLPFLSLASQKSHIGLYHMGIYASSELLEWFQAEYPNHSKTKLNMGKSCIRFKSIPNIPYDLVGELCTKITPKQWIELYETQVN